MNLIICGGSYKGLIFLGVMHYLYKSSKLKNINHFSGCSIGSVIGIFLLMGVEPIEIYNEIMNISFSNYTKMDVNLLLNEFTLVGTSFFNLWKSIFLKHEDVSISIQEFNEKYSCDINIASTCINTRQTVVFNGKDYPEVKVFDAIVASCSIPFVFPPHKIDGLYFDDDTVIVKLPDIKFSEESMTYFSGYMKEILCTLTQDSDLKTNDLTLVVNIPDKYVNKYDFSDLTNKDKTELFLSGITQGQNFFKDKL
jgi:predicted acylesterase/phospholipase RssA